MFYHTHTPTPTAGGEFYKDLYCNMWCLFIMKAAITLEK